MNTHNLVLNMEKSTVFVEIEASGKWIATLHFVPLAMTGTKRLEKADK